MRIMMFMYLEVRRVFVDGEFKNAATLTGNERE